MPEHKRTKPQTERLESCPHLREVSFLEDGDLLVVDVVKPHDTGVFPYGHFGPYILTRTGKIQDVNFHYHVEHGVGCPFSINSYH